MENKLFRWVKASERKPVGKKYGDRASALYKTYPEVLFYNGAEWRWFDQDGQHSKFPVQEDSWSAIEWLDESESTSPEPLRRALDNISHRIKGPMFRMTDDIGEYVSEALASYSVSGEETQDKIWRDFVYKLKGLLDLDITEADFSEGILPIIKDEYHITKK